MGLFDFIGEIFSSAMADTQRTMDKYDKKLSEYEKTHPGSEKAAEAREKLNVQREKLDGASRIRRTDSDFENSVSSDSERNPEDYSYKINVPLSEAKSTADNTTGVYVLYLDGRVMKCGRAAYGQGVRWRLTQYYNLNYDERSRKGDCWSVNSENRDRITVSWQCCPASRCQELEYKLFQKYGKGPWAEKAPSSAGTSRRKEWKLLI